MTTFFKKIYYSIICYDPIIETLNNDTQTNSIFGDKRQHLASPVILNRKQKREFYFEYILPGSNEISIEDTDS